MELVSTLTAEQQGKISLLKESIFLTIGRVPNYEALLTGRPDYLDLHNELLTELFAHEGALTGKVKYYLAFMAAAAHQCEYLMSLEKELCWLSGGNSEWFEAAHQSIPEKIQAIGPINAKLAHRPWDLSTEDLRTVLSNWTMSELAEALVVLCLFHSLSSLVLGLGVAQEYDLPGPRRRKSSITTIRDNLHKAEVVSQLLQETAALDESVEEDEAGDYFEQMSGGSVHYSNYSGAGARLYPSDFNWRDHGYALLERLLPAVAPRLSASLDFAYHKAMSSTRQRAIWVYTQRLYGLEYDDYNYRDVNTELAKPTKAFLKKVACSPHEVVAEDWSQVPLSTEEKVTLVLLVCEARREGELLYALHALRAAM
jgi:hypothetical protein